MNRREATIISKASRLVEGRDRRDFLRKLHSQPMNLRLKSSQKAKLEQIRVELNIELGEGV